jgi:hypothetical protein
MKDIASYIKSLDISLTLLDTWFTMRFNKSRSWRQNETILVTIMSFLKFKEFKGTKVKHCNLKLVDRCNGRTFIGPVKSLLPRLKTTYVKAEI